MAAPRSSSRSPLPCSTRAAISSPSSARTDASILRPQIAEGKAWGVLGMGFGGREFARRAASGPLFLTALMAASGGRIMPVPGGVLIRGADGVIIGSVGITGDTSENDEACAVAGIKAAGLAPDTGEPA